MILVGLFAYHLIIPRTILISAISFTGILKIETFRANPSMILLIIIIHFRFELSFTDLGPILIEFMACQIILCLPTHLAFVRVPSTLARAIIVGFLFKKGLKSIVMDLKLILLAAIFKLEVFEFIIITPITTIVVFCPSSFITVIVTSSLVIICIVD